MRNYLVRLGTLKSLRLIIKRARNPKIRLLFLLVYPLIIWFILLGTIHSLLYKAIALVFIYGFTLITIIPFRRLNKSLVVRKILIPFNSFKTILLVIIFIILLYTISFILSAFLGIDKKIPVSIVAQIVFLGLLVPIVEEVSFRLIPFLVAGINGLMAYSIIWFLWHPLERILGGIEILPLVFTSVLLIVQVPIYVKIWRGKYWWMAFVLHIAVNNWITISAYYFNLSY